jgi:hypothetical protein
MNHLNLKGTYFKARSVSSRMAMASKMKGALPGWSW